jgi:hypothetical protein
VRALLLLGLASCGGAASFNSTGPAASPAVDDDRTADLPRVVVTERTASLGNGAVDDVGALPRFQRLDRIFVALKELRTPTPGKGAPVTPDAIAVEARPGATTVGVFSAVTTCAFAGFRQVTLRTEAGPPVEGEYLVPDRNGLPWDEVSRTAVYVKVGHGLASLAWKSPRSCDEVPVSAEIPVRALAQWLEWVCPAAARCFDRAFLWFEPDVPLLDAVSVLGDLAPHAPKPLPYLAVVGLDRSGPPHRVCGGAR